MGVATPDEIARMGGGTINLSIWEVVKSRFPNATLNSAKTDHDNDGGLHPQGKAIDVGPPNLPGLGEFVFGMRDQLTMIINSNPAYCWYNVGGQRAEGQAAVSIYTAGVVADHNTHFHLGADHVINGSGLPLNPAGGGSSNAQDAGITDYIPGGDAIASLSDAMGKLNELFAWLREPENWRRIAFLVLGTIAVCVAVIMLMGTIIWDMFKDKPAPDASAGLSGFNTGDLPGAPMKKVTTTVKKVVK